jgi:hypothetical protein
VSEKRFYGDQGMAVAVLHYTRLGYIVSVPTTEASRYALIVDGHGQLRRVQVKTTTYQLRGSYVVQLRTSGGEMYPVSPIRRISTDECHLLFVLSGDGNAWQFPAADVAGLATLTLNRQRRGNMVDAYTPILPFGGHQAACPCSA